MGDRSCTRDWRAGRSTDAPGGALAPYATTKTWRVATAVSWAINSANAPYGASLGGGEPICRTYAHSRCRASDVNASHEDLRARQERRNVTSSMTCHLCGGVGHLKRDCHLARNPDARMQMPMQPPRTALVRDRHCDARVGPRPRTWLTREDKDEKHAGYAARVRRSRYRTKSTCR